MKFSILIPVYNAEEYLAEAIESVLLQEYDEFEIIIVDDGSTDNSEKVYREYELNYPDRVHIIKQQNSGQLASRCRAIQKATGEYCLFLDSDDLLVENTLNSLSAIIDEYEMPDLVVFPFYYDRDGVLEKSKMLSEKETVYKSPDMRLIYQAFFEGTLLNSMWTKAVKREIVQKSIDGYERYIELRCSEDRYQSMMIISNIKNMVYITNPFYRYRLVKGSTTRNFLTSNIPRFNTKLLYNPEVECIKKWGMDFDDMTEKLQASWVKYTLYVMDLFYNNVKPKDRKNVLRYPWKDFLPEEICIKKIYENPYLELLQKRIWRWIDSGSFIRLKLYFCKKNLYKKVRSLKKAIFN